MRGCACEAPVINNNSEVGYKSDLFDRVSEHAVKYALNWLKEHDPKLVQTKQEETFIDGKLSLLLGGQTVMVGGRTPPTVPRQKCS